MVFMRPIKYRAWDKTEKKMYDLRDMYFNVSIDHPRVVFEMPFEMVDEDWKDHDLVLLAFTGLTDRNGTEIYEGHVIKWNTGIGYIKYVADEYTLGFEVELIAGSNFYGYEGEHYDWTSVEVIGHIYEDDLINKYKYGVTASFKPVSRESAKKKFVNAVKRGWYHKGDWVPTQSEIPDRIGIRMQDVVNELRDELVKEGKIIQDPKRYWMCKVEENPGLLKGK